MLISLNSFSAQLSPSYMMYTMSILKCPPKPIKTHKLYPTVCDLKNGFTVLRAEYG